jgi:phage terminase large subunit-like protein
VSKFTISKNKVTRAEPFASQWQAGNVELARGPWNEAFLQELEEFPDGGHDDQVDASAGAFSSLMLGRSDHATGAPLESESLRFPDLELPTDAYNDEESCYAA